MTEFNFDIDQIANNAVVKTDKTTEIIQSTETTETGQISFLEKLTPEQQTAIEARVPQLVDNFIADQNALLDFGQTAVEEVNKTVNHILTEQKKLDIPQVDDLLLNTNRELNGFIAKYKDVTPAELEKKPNFFQKMLKQSKNTLQDFYFDAQSIEQKMDSMAAHVVKHEDNLELLLIGIRPDYQKKGVNALIFCDMFETAIKVGFTYAETNAELEDNRDVQTLWAGFDFEQHKRRRAYTKHL